MHSQESVLEWSSDDGTQAESELQPACPTAAPGRSQLRPARNTLPFVPYADWDAGQSYDDVPPTCILYVLEWKITFNNRQVRKQTEEGLVVAPGEFWDEDLSIRVEDIAKKTAKPSMPDTTTIIMSVNDRGESDITKSYKELQVDWSVVERQLRSWSHLLRIGKKLKVNACFKYVEDKSATSTRRGGTTATMLAERETRLAASQAALGGPEAYPYVFRIMRCPGAPCDLGPYCWQDPHGQRHHKLLGHHLRELVKFVQTGGKLESHEDVPENIRLQLHAEARDRPDRKRKRNNSASTPTGQSPMIINNYIPAHHDAVSQNKLDNWTDAALASRATPEQASIPPLLKVPGLRDDAVMEYCRWHCSKVRRTDQKIHYALARDLTLDHGFDLELVYESKNPQFYSDHGVLPGVAQRFVRDIREFLEYYCTAQTS
ncbi:hypothetical protein Purlil1_13462 [Purpureocillium lilacinum]|uniref:Uncharacterized protein n=1 Tax=Purpureocillium lilacinum TaxID=33203 RepID=A0ABR0BE15_PURLI|nr:hypothetical protein Purlil1_13462 [Purpureocillium lilacinum]